MKLKFRNRDTKEVLVFRQTEEGTLVLWNVDSWRSHYIDEGFNSFVSQDGVLRNPGGDSPTVSLQQWTGEYDDQGNEVYIDVEYPQ